jgi:hypothetical protein
MLSREAQPLGEARRDDPLDLLASLGGLPHEITAIALSDCEFLCWPVDDLWRFEPFAAASRRYLASALSAAQARLDELQAPCIMWERGDTPAPLHCVTMVMALCDATGRSGLLPGLALLSRPTRAARLPGAGEVPHRLR